MIPAAVAERVARAGVRRVTDNLPDGAALAIVPGEFLRWFRPEIEAGGLLRRPPATPALAAVTAIHPSR